MIFIDASRYNNVGEKTGVENYSVHLIDALATLAPDQITLVAPKKIPLDVLQLTIPFPRLWTQIRLSYEALKNQIFRNGTLFVPSHQMPLIHPKNTVITIHDVAFKRFPESYSLPSRMYLNWGARFAVRHAKKIITPSQTTKDDLIKFYHANPEKIAVIPHGYSPLNAPHSSPIANRYFLFIGRIETKKNLLTLIRAFNQIKTDCQLVLAGKPGVGYGEIEAEAKKNPQIMLAGYVDDDTKAALLQNALAFVFPSLYEGFGIPLLEAMQFNLPIIASDIPASREVAGDSIEYFPVENAEKLAQKMKYLIQNPNTPNYKSILQQYSWKTCAEKTRAVLT